MIAARPARARARRLPVPLAHRARSRSWRSRCRSSRPRSCSTCWARPSTRSRSPAWRRRSRSSSTTPSSAPRASRGACASTREGGQRRVDRAASCVEASHELRRPLVYATLIALLAVVPVAVMEGRPGAFFEPLGARLRAGRAGGDAGRADGDAGAQPAAVLERARAAARVRRCVRRLAPRYAAALSRVRRAARGRCWSPPAPARSSALAALPLLGTSRGAGVQGPRRARPTSTREPGTSQPADDADRDARSAASCAAIPGVDDVGAHVGRAVTGDQIVDVNSERALGQHRPGRRLRRDARVDRGRRRRARGARAATSSPTRSRRSATSARSSNGEQPGQAGDGLDVLTGTDKPLVVRVFGEDLETLRARGREGARRRRRRRRRRRPERRAAGRRSRRSRSRSSSTQAQPRRSSPATCAAPRPRCCRASRSAASSGSRRSSTSSCRACRRRAERRRASANLLIDTARRRARAPRRRGRRARRAGAGRDRARRGVAPDRRRGRRQRPQPSSGRRRRSRTGSRTSASRWSTTPRC